MIGKENINTWEEFKELEIEEQVGFINGLLLEGYTIPKISESIEGKNHKPLDRTVIAKHFMRYGYKRMGNAFTLNPAIEPTPTTKRVHKPQVKADPPTYINQFTMEEVEILQRVAREYKLRDFVIGDTLEEEKGESANRNIRVYTKQYQEFAEFCKVNHLKQCDALYNAISAFMARVNQ